jgi:uncharacterized LabA/DUF88 family protein
MLFYPTERLALFVDGPNIYGAAKALQFDVDYKKLLEGFAKRGTLIRAFYYTAVNDSEEFSPLRPLVDYLEYNGWRMVTKPAREFTDSQGRKRFKGDMDVDLAVDALEIAPHVDHLVIFSGDGDFVPLVAALQRLGKRVTVCSTIKSTPPLCADELRRQADNFAELEELRTQIERPRTAHAPR